jgi:AraC-like DNA-binding protein
MPGSFTAVFGEPDDYQAALRAEGVVELLVTGHGPFRARLTEIVLHRVRLAAGDEEIPRIAAIAVPAGTVLVALALGGRHPPIWGGITLPTAGEILTAGPGERLHTLMKGPGRWGMMLVPRQDLVAYGGTVTGSLFVVPPGLARFRPAPSAARNLLDLHRAAVGVATRSDALAGGEAAHGLEQQLIHALIESLWAAAVHHETLAGRRHRDLLVRFEALLDAGSPRRAADFAAALGVSERLLRSCCAAHLGVSPGHYRHRRALQRVHRELSRADPATATVAGIAARYGYADPGRLAAGYRAVYGELPSATLRRRAHGIAELGLGRRSIKIS